ncbi:MAG: LysR family transcriptional regulator [Calothrix sp. SM1_7_51]|nr:LysR family transcriptional regulator [Calothrix sp. SM1_7_51]
MRSHPDKVVKENLLNTLTLENLKVFEAVARHRHFSRAAEELFITQPSVSNNMKQLAKTVGLPLLEHLGKRTYLTQTGEELFLTCKEIFEHLEQLETKFLQLKGMKNGKLRLAAVGTTKYIITKLLRQFCEVYPDITVSMIFSNQESVLSRMHDNLDDLYILSAPPEKEDIEVEPFLDNPLVVVAPINHPLVNQTNISLECLAQEKFIIREVGSRTRTALQQVFTERGMKVQAKLELSSNEAIKQAVIIGLGIAVLSVHTLHNELKNNKLTILNVEGFPIYQKWHVIYPKKKYLSVTAKTFLEYLLVAIHEK